MIVLIPSSNKGLSQENKHDFLHAYKAKSIQRKTGESILSVDSLAYRLNHSEEKQLDDTRLTFMGHATKNKFGTMTALQMAELIDKLPDTITEIVLFACNIGLEEKGESFVLQVRKELKKRKEINLSAVSFTKEEQETHKSLNPEKQHITSLTVSLGSDDKNFIVARSIRLMPDR